MKLTSIGTIGRLGSPFVFNIPQSAFPQDSQRTIGNPYGMLGYMQPGARDPLGNMVNAGMPFFQGNQRTIGNPYSRNGMLGGAGDTFTDDTVSVFFQDFSWLEDTSKPAGGSSDEYTSAVAETVRESTPDATIEYLKKFANDSGVSNATKQIVNLAVQRGVNEVKEFLTPDDVGKKTVNPTTGKGGVIKQDPKNPNNFIIQYDDGTILPYDGSQILVGGKSSSSNNNLFLIAGLALAAILLMK
jgi:hypothetical protein